jgi:insulysin
MKAVDSEYNMSLQHDGWRKFNLIQNIAHGDSVLRRFNCGNLESLKQDGVRDNLLKFHKTWYSSNIMNLAMVGKASLDEMQKWAEEKFSGVENKGVTIPDYSQPIMPFNEANLG